LVEPPDSAALLVHDGHDVAGAADGIEVDDRVVAEAEFVDVVDEEVKVVLVTVLVLIANFLGAPVLVAVVVGAGVDDHDVEAHLWQRVSPWIRAFKLDYKIFQTFLNLGKFPKVRCMIFSLVCFWPYCVMRPVV